MTLNNATVMKVYFKRIGEHVRCRVFTAPHPDLTFALCGELCFDKREFHDVTWLMVGAQWIEEVEG